MLATAFGAGCDWRTEEPVPVHAVVRGDTLTKIARANGVTVAELKEWNGLSSDRIEVGQELKLLGGSGAIKAPAPAAKKRAGTGNKKAAPSKKPRPKACLKGPSLDDLDNDDVDIRGSMGLDQTQIRSAMAPFLPSLGVCFSDEWPTASVHFEIVAGCNGLVSSVRVLDGGGLDGAILGCLTDRLGSLGFPAHDMPDGFRFEYPMTVSP